MLMCYSNVFTVYALLACALVHISTSLSPAARLREGGRKIITARYEMGSERAIICAES